MLLATALACEPPAPSSEGAGDDRPVGAETRSGEGAPSRDSQTRTPGTAAATPRVATLEYDGGRFEAEFGGRGELPTGFPDDVPIYQGSEPRSSMAAPGRGKLVHLRTAADSDHVFAYYREALETRGWEEESTSSRLGNHEIEARKGNRVTRVNIQTDGSDTLILLSVAEER